MSCFKRAEWHSGLTYEQTCEQCKTVVRYDDYKLDFRPWYADGFVYCPTCKKPLRHNENYAINDKGSLPTKNAQNSTSERACFCPACGKQFGEEDNFCAKCGKKRD